MSTHIRLQDGTKKAVDKALITARANDPNIHTHDDLQKYLLTKANLRSIDDIILDDFKILTFHLQLAHQDTTPEIIEQITYQLEEILFIGADKEPELLLKELRDIKEKVRGWNDEQKG